jgi:geranylgeranyl diphosphate synthase type I
LPDGEPVGIRTTSVLVENVEQVLRQYAAEVEAEMATIVEDEVADTWMRQAIGYHLGWLDADFRPLNEEVGRSGGKKLRPALAILSYRAAALGPHGRAWLADDLSRVLPFAAALELLHNYTLIHDDIQDDDRTRRGRPTLWTICGTAQAINVGNCLHAISLHCLERLANRGFDAADVARLSAALAHASVELAIGQRRDLAFENEQDVGPGVYLEMVAGKTAGLLRCASYGGALLATDGSRPGAAKSLTAFGEFGMHLGLAFQIRDDVLGIWGAEEDTGKPSGSDIRRRKKSLPIIFALQAASEEAFEQLSALYSLGGELTTSEEACVRRILGSCAAAALAQSQAEEQRERALSALGWAAGNGETLRTNPFLANLAELADFVTHRSS